jgi:hypothetical protein
MGVRVWCGKCKAEHVVERGETGLWNPGTKEGPCGWGMWYEIDNGFAPYPDPATAARVDAALHEATMAGVCPTYKPTEEGIERDVLALEQMQKSLAVVLVHNLPGTPLLSFSVYGVGRAYAAALQMIEGYQDAGTNNPPENVQGEGSD